MQLFYNYCSVLFTLLLSLCLALSVPTTDSIHEQQALTEASLPRSLRFPSLITKICGEVIEQIWPHYKESSLRFSKLHSAPTDKVLSRYGDDVVLRFKIETREEAEAFAEAVNTLYLDVWEASKSWADVRMSRKVLPSFLTLLPPSMQQSHTPIISQLSQAVYDTFPLPRQTDTRHRHQSSMPHDLFFQNYQPLSVIYPWLRQLASMFPDRSQLFTIGTSWEGRDIPALRIGFESPEDSPDKDEPRPTILITAGIHAREWISTSTASYLIRGLLHNSDPRNRHLIESLLTHYDFVFVPVLNPDGYDYTWTTDRLWRKNRQETSLPFCRGIDLDRAFAYGWDGGSQLDNPCSESYAGERPLQAVEAQRLVEWAKNETRDGKRTFRGFLDLHSYSQEILYPYSYTCDRRPKNLEDLEEIAIGLAKAFRLTYGHYYTVDSACEGSVTSQTPISAKSTRPESTRIEESGGSALDFFYQEMGVRNAFQIKLRDTGSYGFLLPKENIVPTGVETFNALMGLGRWMLGNKGIEHYSHLNSEEIWGQEAVIVSEYNSEAMTTEDNDVEDDGPWWKSRRR